MNTTVKVWASDESRPEGDKLSNIHSAPPNWFREEPVYAAELYGLERANVAAMYGVPLDGPRDYHVLVLDDQGVTHEFTVRVRHELVAHVTPRRL